MTTTTLPASISIYDGALLLQRKVVRVIAQIVVQDDDGTHVCSITSRAEYNGKPLTTLQSLLFGFVNEWSLLYNQLILEVRQRHFGHLCEKQIQMIDVVLGIGTHILTGLVGLHHHDHEEKAHQLADHILDMKAAVQSLTALQLSYDQNHSDDMLEKLAMAN